MLSLSQLKYMREKEDEDRYYETLDEFNNRDKKQRGNDDILFSEDTDLS